MILNGRQLIEVLPLAELYTVYQHHERLGVFVEKGLYCATCTRRGTLLLVTQETTNKHGNLGRTHVDLYTDDFILMTVDHIVPKKVAKSLGWDKLGIESLDNKQPMCDPCNNKKGCKPVSNEQLTLYRKNAKLSTGIEIIRSLVPNLHRLNDDDLWLGG